MSDNPMTDLERRCVAALGNCEAHIEDDTEALAIVRAVLAEAGVAELVRVVKSAQPSICYLACEHGSTFEPSDPRIVHSDLCDELRAALAKVQP